MEAYRALTSPAALRTQLSSPRGGDWIEWLGERIERCDSNWIEWCDEPIERYDSDWIEWNGSRGPKELRPNLHFLAAQLSCFQRPSLPFAYPFSLLSPSVWTYMTGEFTSLNILPLTHVVATFKLK